jgi:hypothetical protein
MTDIDANWAYRCRVAQSQPDVIGIERCKLMEAYTWKNIAAIVKDREPKTLLDWEWNTRL